MAAAPSAYDVIRDFIPARPGREFVFQSMKDPERRIRREYGHD